MQTFVIAPAGRGPLWVLMPVMLIMAGVVVVLLASVLGSRSSRFEVSPEGLRLRGDWYGRFIPTSELISTAATRVDWAAQPGLEPRRRTLGTGMPGYRAGWFTLQNGDRALLYLTDRARAVYIPTTRGYGLLLSPSDPDAFLTALRAIGTQ